MQRSTLSPELEARYRRLQKCMDQAGLDAVIMVQNADLYYFTGTLQNGVLYVPASGQPLYMVRKSLDRARCESALEQMVALESMRSIPRLLAIHGYPEPHHLGLELDVMPYNFYERLRQVFPKVVWADASPAIRKVRMIKSPYELSLMKAAGEQADNVYRHAREILRAGMTEIELAAELEHRARLDGHTGLIRMRGFNGEMLFAHVCSGPDSAVPCYLDTPLGGVGPHPSFGQGASWRRIERGQPVLIDNAGLVQGYLVDQTRVLVLGELPARLARAYEDMLRIQRLMQESIAPGVLWGDLYDRCLALAIELGYADHFMGAKGAQTRFIGHGLGLEIDEYPLIARGFADMAMEPGMAFAFEPKVVFPGQGAVGIENTFCLRDQGLEALTYSDEAVARLP